MKNENDSGNTSGSISQASLQDMLKQRYLTYALSTITNRALPDVRDGLKPVHRRLLYAMAGLNLFDNFRYKKSARVVGDVIGKYHPHGDQAVYDAMVRLAQPFSTRYPLVDGQGNFGNIDGDSAAAMRYTESRLTKVAKALLEGIEEDCVNFRPTYDDSSTEPVVFPAAFPNLLANGTTGIAVGMATSIPPHNVDEICQALVHVIDNKNTTLEDILSYIKGPDFPTGGIITNTPEQMLAAYSTGRGSFTVRAKWHVEQKNKKGYIIIVTEIPFQVQKSRVVEKIAALITDKKIPLLVDVRDESADDMRLVLEAKADMTEPDMFMELLFQHTELEIKFSLNFNVLKDGISPDTISLHEALTLFLHHRRDVLLRRTNFHLEKARKRISILEGYITAHLNIERIIEIIRTEDEPAIVMMQEFSLTEIQVEGILNMRLRALRKLEETKMKAELDELSKKCVFLADILHSETQQWVEIRREIVNIRKNFGATSPRGERLTEIKPSYKTTILSRVELIQEEDITVICSTNGWIRAIKGHNIQVQDVRFREGDNPRFCFHAKTTDKLLLFTTQGKFYTILCSKLPAGGRSMGEPVRTMLDLEDSAGIVFLNVFTAKDSFFLASKSGRGFVVLAENILATKRSGKQVLNLANDDQAKICLRVTGEYIAVINTEKRLLVFSVSELPELTKGKGVILLKNKTGHLADATIFQETSSFQWLVKPNNAIRTCKDFSLWVGRRGTRGKTVPKGFPKNLMFAASCNINTEQH